MCGVLSKAAWKSLRGGDVKNQKGEWVSLLAFLVLCLGAGFLGAGITQAEIPGWYAGLQKPLGNPPNWVFAPVWTTLYILMAVAAWRIFCRRAQGGTAPAMVLFFIQLGLNALWTPVFFGWHRTGLALAVILLLLVLISATSVLFRKIDKAASILLLPYLVWVSYASYLNAGLWWLNRAGE